MSFRRAAEFNYAWNGLCVAIKYCTAEIIELLIEKGQANYNNGMSLCIHSSYTQTFKRKVNPTINGKYKKN